MAMKGIMVIEHLQGRISGARFMRVFKSSSTWVKKGDGPNA
jgi:hypothetical protein